LVLTRRRRATPENPVMNMTSVLGETVSQWRASWILCISGMIMSVSNKPNRSA